MHIILHIICRTAIVSSFVFLALDCGVSHALMQCVIYVPSTCTSVILFLHVPTNNHYPPTNEADRLASLARFELFNIFCLIVQRKVSWTNRIGTYSAYSLISGLKHIASISQTKKRPMNPTLLYKTLDMCCSHKLDSINYQYCNQTVLYFPINKFLNVWTFGTPLLDTLKPDQLLWYNFRSSFTGQNRIMNF